MPPFVSRLGFAFATLFVAPVLFASMAAAQTSPRIGIASAQFFNARTGQLSADVLNTAEAWGNTPAGPFASTSTFVTVRVDFGANQPVPVGARAALTATDVRRVGRKLVRRTLSSSSAQIGPAASDGSTHIGFWLADTGCRPITLNLVLTAANGTTVLATGRGELPFACYE